MEGKILQQLKVTQAWQVFNINLPNWPETIFTVVLKNDGKIISVARGIKQ